MTTAITQRAERVAELAYADRPGQAALEVARFAYPDMNVPAVMSRIDGLASAVEGSTHLALRRLLGVREGIGGNVDDYYDPDNSYLNCVLDSRRGIPISLSVLYIEVGRRAGIEVQGVGLPGHFVVYAGGQLIDPFHYGAAIGFDEAASLVASALGGSPRLDRSWLDPVSTVDIVRRMLRNLESIYFDRQDAASLEWIGACLSVL